MATGSVPFKPRTPSWLSNIHLHRKPLSNAQKDGTAKGRAPERKERIRAELNGRTKTEKNEKRANRGESPQLPVAETIG
jgi:hypothetical protein